MTVRDTFPLLLIDESIEYLGDYTVFSSLYINSAYCQTPLEYFYHNNTTFTYHYGTNRFNQMPFGLINSPSTPQSTLEVLLNQINCDFCLLYLYNIIIFSGNPATHLLYFYLVLTTMHRPGISLKLKKCECFTASINYLGHIIKTVELNI